MGLVGRAEAEGETERKQSGHAAFSGSQDMSCLIWTIGFFSCLAPKMDSTPLTALPAWLASQSMSGSAQGS